MRIIDIRERTVAISRYADPSIPSGGLTTSIVAVVTDAVRCGKPVVGYGFSSMGRFGQAGLIRERFAPRLLDATSAELTDPEGNLDPFQAWRVMMTGEKPGGHGERCVAVGTLDMAIWDAAAKIAGLPLHRFLAERAGEAPTPVRDLPVYASGGYLYPHEDISRLANDIRRLVDGGYTRFKIKIGSAPLAQDLKRIEAVLSLLPNSNDLAVDAMNAFDAGASLTAARALARYGLWWFEDVCDPLDFETQAAVVAAYGGAIAAGEALFSVAEAKLLNLHGGMRRDRDILLFDPVHCYGLPGYLQMVDHLKTMGWPRSAFWPHGGHPFCLHVVAALGLGGAEINPLSFSPFGGLLERSALAKGRVRLPDAPGIGFELSAALHDLFSALHKD